MNIETRENILNQIKIVSPCTVSWDYMQGNNTVRDCAHCNLSVHNISEMSQYKAEELIENHKGDLCVRLYRRPDGTLIINDSIIESREVKRPFKTILQTAATLLSFLLGISIAQANNAKVFTDSEQTGSTSQSKNKKGQSNTETDNTTNKKPNGKQRVVKLMGKICLPKPPIKPPEKLPSDMVK